MNPRSTIFKILLPAMCAIPAAMLLAQAPTTRPAEGRPMAGFGSGPRGERRLGQWGGGMGGALREKGLAPTEAERQAAEQFLKTELPNRYALFAELKANSPMRQRVLEFMAFKYRVLLRVKDQDPDMYELLLREAKLEDEAMKLAMDARHGDASAESKLHDKARELVDLGLENRSARIERLEEQLARQKEQLARDTERRDERIEEKASQLRRDFNRLLDGIENRSRNPGAPPPAASPGAGKPDGAP